MNVIIKDENSFLSFTEKEFLKMFEKSLHRAFIRYTIKREDKGDSWNDIFSTSMESLRDRLKEKLKRYSECSEHERFEEMCDLINFALMLAEREYEEMFERWRGDRIR